MPDSAAEEALAAFARDLVEEISAARALELAADADTIDLAVFNIRGFHREQRTKTGRIIPEQVRGHMESRLPGLGKQPEGGPMGPPEPGGGREHFVQGQPSHEIHDTSEAKWQANQWKGDAGPRWQDVDKVFSGIRDTRGIVRGEGKGYGRREMGAHVAFLHARNMVPLPARDHDADYHLDQAQQHLTKVNSGLPAEERGQHLAQAYHHLAEAHRIGTQHALPSAGSKPEQEAVREVLDKIQEHMKALDKLQGAKSTATQQLTEVPKFNPKRAKSIDRLRQDIMGTSDRVLGNSMGKKTLTSRDLDIWMSQAESDNPVAHLDQAQRSLEAAQGGRAEGLSEAYHHLAEAHRLAVEQALPRAQVKSPEHAQDVHDVLDKIEGHMQALDKLAGTDPQMTKRLLGSTAQRNERASAIRDEARRQLNRAGEVGDPRQVGRLRHTGLVSPEDEGKAFERAMNVLQERENGAILGIPPVEYAQGASAIFPQTGAHLGRLPGGTISGHEFANRATPFPAQPVIPGNPLQGELDKAQGRIESMTTREDQRRATDLKDHLAAISAMEAERQGMAARDAYAPLSDEDFILHSKKVELAIENALRKGLATDQQFSLDGQGQVWAPERAMAHADIIKEFMDRQVDVPSQHEALFLGGLPGAGKSSLLRHHPEVGISNYAVINPDDFKEELMKRGLAPEVEGLSPMETAALVHEESAYLADLAATELTRRGKNLAFDVTMKNYEVTEPRVSDLKDKGYSVRAVFVDVPVEKSAQRVENRYRKGLESYRQGKNPLGGRYIPRAIVLRGEDTPGISRARTTFDRLRPEFTSWELYDGTEGLATLRERSAPATLGGGIQSAEQLRRAARADRPGYVGSTEPEARAAEQGEEEP